jgi:anthranilate synthase component 1
MIQPTVEEIHQIQSTTTDNIIPIFKEISSDTITPVSAYLRLTQDSSFSFLFESVLGGEKIGRFSFVGSNPFKILKTGPNELLHGDPLIHLENEINKYKFHKLDFQNGFTGFTGGAVGFITYDCVSYFEPRVVKNIPELRDPLQIPEAVFMFFDTIVVFDHLYQVCRIISHVRLDLDSNVDSAYSNAVANIDSTLKKLNHNPDTFPHQPPITLGHQPISNVGKQGYEDFVCALKEYIKKGDIIQCVPSQRIVKKTELHPFNAYRALRRINPSPYMFYVNVGDDFQIGK